MTYNEVNELYKKSETAKEFHEKLTKKRVQAQLFDENAVFVTLEDKSSPKTRALGGDALDYEEITHTFEFSV